MGKGPEDLDKKLLTSFLQELLKSDPHVDLIGSVNSTIKLTTEGSEVIDILRQFEQKGTRTATCGTCLDYNGLREKADWRNRFYEDDS